MKCLFVDRGLALLVLHRTAPAPPRPRRPVAQARTGRPPPRATPPPRARAYGCASQATDLLLRGMNVGDRDSGPGPSGAPSTSPPLADAVTHASHRVEVRITEDARRGRGSAAGGGGGAS